MTDTPEKRRRTPYLFWGVLLTLMSVLAVGTIIAVRLADVAAPGERTIGKGQSRLRGFLTASPTSSSITGVVEGPESVAATATVVLTRCRSADELSEEFGDTFSTTATSGGGKFAFSGLEAGCYWLGATATDGLVAFFGPIQLGLGHTSRARLALSRKGVTLSGSVRDSAGGPVPGARLFGMPSTSGTGSTMVVQARSGDDGAYSMVLPPGTYDVVVGADGYATSRESLAIWSSSKRSFSLIPEGRLPGRVIRRQDRKDVAEAEVQLISAASGAPVANERTGSGGEFEIRGIGPGPYYLMARKGRLVGRAGPVIVHAARTATDVVVEIDTGLRMEGRVHQKGGGPVASATIRATPNDGTSGLSWQGTSGPGGQYALEGVPAGTLRVSASAPGFYPEERTITLSSDLSRLDLRLDRPRVVAGRVVGASGKAVAGASIQANIRRGVGNTARNEPVAQPVKSGEDGAFKIEVKASVDPVLSAYHPEQGNAEVNLPAPVGAPAPLVITLRPGAKISGRVLRAGGEPGGGVQVTLSSMSSEANVPRTSTASDNEGRFEFTALPRGTYLVGASVKVWPGWSETSRSDLKRVTVADSRGIENVELLLAGTDHTLTGVVKDDKGTPLGATLRILEEVGGGPIDTPPVSARTAFTTAEGKFHFNELAAGNYTVWASCPGYADVRRAGVAVGTAGSTPLSVTLTKGAELDGRVADAEGKPVEDFFLTDIAGRDPPEGGRRRRYSNREGTFRLEGLRAGAYTLRAEALEGGTAETKVNLAPGERKGVLLSLEAVASVRGRVVDAETGQVLPGVLVEMKSNTGTVIRGTTNESGVFVARGPMSEKGRINLVPPETHVPEFGPVETSAVGPVRELGDLAVIRKRREDKPDPPGWLGIGLNPSTGRGLIAKVLAGSPAERAGLRAGDRITDIDGVSLNRLNLGSALYLLRGRAGTQTRLRVAAASGTRELELSREPPPTGRP
jgi:hypothetical protein